MGASYYQFCPVSKAMELLDERGTLLVLRELLVGSEHFNDLRRGLPRMSPSLLSKRLRQLVRAGVVDKRGEGAEVRYLLTPAGRELRPIIEALGAWGTHWIGELGDEDLDPQLLLWDMHRNIDHAATPGGRTVVQFRFPDLQVHGPEDLRRAAPGWFTLSPFASVPRPADERSMALPARSPGQRHKTATATPRHHNAGGPARQPAVGLGGLQDGGTQQPDPAAPGRLGPE